MLLQSTHTLWQHLLLVYWENDELLKEIYVNKNKKKQEQTNQHSKTRTHTTKTFSILVGNHLFCLLRSISATR